ncbi:SusC/RagA family TonB-linked outer membrane protein [Flavobacterium collinsii]|nr:SusC/RagA family TonB-linked outer membrane protein [Flavobacterium collinsii]
MNIFSFSKGGKAFYCLILTGFLLSFSPSAAKNSLRRSTSIIQQHQVQGTVTDGTSPLPGVSISLKGNSKTATISDYNGHFSIQAASQDTLVVSYLGFKTVYIPIKSRSKIDIVLQYDTTTLQEVKVNAGYYSVKESERTGSIARITSKDIETQPVTNVLATMQGRMAGVSITQTTGTPGGGFDIKIRGQNSLRNDANNPLYIIDGVPYSSEPVGYNQTGTIFPALTNPINNINPDNIESIEILKDADATSIYGSRGANGVVLITTKKGKGGKTGFTIKASTGAGTVTKFMKLMNTEQYLAMRRQAFAIDGIQNYPMRAYDVNGTWNQNRYTDWQKEFLGGTSLIRDLQTGISGGSERTQFIISGSLHTESTVFPGEFLYKKGGLQSNFNHKSEDSKFKLSFSVGYNMQDNNQPAFDLTVSSRSLPPNAPALYDTSGNLNWANNTWQNPLRFLSAEFKSKSNDLTANTMLSYEILPNLSIKSSFGFTDLRHSETRSSPSTVNNPSFNLTSANSSAYFNDTERQSWIAEPQLSWDKEFAFGRIGLLAGCTFQSQTTARLYQIGTGFSSNDLIYDLASASSVRILFSDNALYKYQAFFGRLNYNWKERYILNLTGRRDGSSRFGPGNQFATFGAVGFAWLFSNEKFLSRTSWLSFGKFRGSYGTTGNDQIGDYQFLDTYNSSGLSYDSSIGLRPARLFNPEFSWEINKKLEVALEVGFLKDRIFATAAWYRNRSSNQLVGVALPGTTGFSSIQANLQAEVQNSGWELTLRTVNLAKKDFKWTSSINITIDENKLLSYPDLSTSTYSQKYRIGQPLNIVLGYQYNGVDQQTGLYSFSDLNGDGKISAPNDKQSIININPKFFGGLQNQLSYKRLKLDFLFQFVKQNALNYYIGYPGQMLNQPARLADSWTSPTSASPYQLYTTGTNGAAVTADAQYSQSTGAVTDASYIRLKNISLAYELPLEIKNTTCRVFLQGQNLLTFTPYNDGDPEFITAGYLPPLKIITAGIQLSF